MNETVKELLSEMGEESMSDKNLSKLIDARFEEAKKIKQKRISRIQVIKSFMERLTNAFNSISESGEISKNIGRVKYISPIATTVVEKKAASDWVPDFTFDPEERFGEGSDIYRARNSSRVFNFGLKIGKFRRECQNGAQDLFEKGRMVLSMGYLTRSESFQEEVKDEVEDKVTMEDREYHKATFIRFRQKPWESVYWTKDEHCVMFIEEFSLGEAIEIFGEDVRNFKIHAGSIYDVEGEQLDCNNEKDLRKTIQVAHTYCDTEKIYACQIGGKENFYKKMTGKRYPFLDEWGDGYIPVTFIDSSAIKIDGHPISDLDKILPICINYDKIFQGVIRKAEKASRSTDIIGSTDPAKHKLEYLQSEANDQAGLDIPHFMKVEEGTQLFAKTLETPFDLNSPLAIRNAFIEEIMMTTGVNLRLLGGGADTARQEELRIRRELEVIDEMIKVNEPDWEQMALNYMQMLKNADADFYDEYVAIEDEISARNGIPQDGTVRDVIEELEGFPFNVRVSVNQSNSKRKALEIAQKESALQTIAPFAPGSPAVARMAYNIAEEKFPGLKFTEEDFVPTQPPQGAPGGAPAIPDQLANGPVGNPAQELAAQQ